MPERIYTRGEANELLPYLSPTLVELREKFEEAARIRAVIAQAAMTNGGSANRDEEQRLLGRVAELLDRLREWEIELRDVATGLVDFPAIMQGEPAWLCWRLGEPEVNHWHGPDEGFVGRRSIEE
ncbi:MAG: DUF2203 domain-containing protein [Actinomycetota bacterium]